MKMFKLTTFLAILSVAYWAQSLVRAQEDHEDEHGHKHSHEHGHGHGEEQKFGKGRAIAQVRDDGNSFQLSQKAESTLGIKFEKSVNLGPNSFRVPASALVEYQDRFAIFVKRGDLYVNLPIKLVSNDGNQIRFESGRLRESDSVIVSGTALVRVAHLEASGQGGEGHAH